MLSPEDNQSTLIEMSSSYKPPVVFRTADLFTTHCMDNLHGASTNPNELQRILVAGSEQSFTLGFPDWGLLVSSLGEHGFNQDKSISLLG